MAAHIGFYLEPENAKNIAETLLIGHPFIELNGDVKHCHMKYDIS